MRKFYVILIGFIVIGGTLCAAEEQLAEEKSAKIKEDLQLALFHTGMAVWDAFEVYKYSSLFMIDMAGVFLVLGIDHINQAGEHFKDAYNEYYRERGPDLDNSFSRDFDRQ